MKIRIHKKVGIGGLITGIVAVLATLVAIFDYAPATAIGAGCVWVLFIVLVIGHRMGWGGGTRTAPVTDTGHHPMLFDGAVWTCKHGVKPHKRTMLCAWPIGHDKEVWPVEPTERERRERIDL
jgi:hypothetical protein